MTPWRVQKVEFIISFHDNKADQKALAAIQGFSRFIFASENVSYILQNLITSIQRRFNIQYAFGLAFNLRDSLLPSTHYTKQSWNKILRCANRNERLSRAGGIVQGEPVLACQLIGRRAQHFIPIGVIRSAIGSLADDDIGRVGAFHLHRPIIDPRTRRRDPTPDGDRIGASRQRLTSDFDGNLSACGWVRIANRNKGLRSTGAIA